VILYFPPSTAGKRAFSVAASRAWKSLTLRHLGAVPTNFIEEATAAARPGVFFSPQLRLCFAAYSTITFGHGASKTVVTN